MKLIYLSKKFYSDYGGCPEILQKPSRPYVCLAVKIGSNTFAIPFRHHISHKYAFITSGTAGLDYSKAVVINDLSYIDPSTPQVSQADFNALKGKDKQIETGMRNFVNLYKKAKRYKNKPFYRNILKYTSLQYFI